MFAVQTPSALPDSLKVWWFLAFPIAAFLAAIKGASGPKGVLLLFDHNHLYMLLHGGSSLEELICRVRRHASQTGEAYLSPRHFHE